MAKSGERDMAKERRWRQIFADWQMTGVSMAEYCRQKDLKYTQFVDWGKRFRKRDASNAPKLNRQRMADRAKRIANQAAAEYSRSVEFAEVQLVENRRAEKASLSPASVDAVLEIEFPSGTKLRVPAGCSTGSLAAVVALLEGR